MAVYKKDVDISLVFAADLRDGRDFQEEWVRRFPDGHATLVVAAVRYRGAIVFEWTGVIADGGRYLLPLPEPRGDDGKFFVPKSKLPLAS